MLMAVWARESLSSVIRPSVSLPASMDSFASMVAGTTLVKLRGQKKTKRHECGKETCREEEEWQGWEGDGRGWRNESMGVIRYRHETINEQILLIKT